MKARRSPLWMAPLLLVALAWIPTGSPAQAAARSSATIDCSAALRSDPYTLTTSVLNACGFHRFSRLGVNNLPGGGREYVYIVAGARTTIPVPPAGFNPLTASARQLAEYSLPQRPRIPALLTAWREKMAKLRPVVPPAELISKPITASTTSTTNSHWSGYLATSTNSSHFFQATTTYTEPTLYSSACSTNYVVIWSGLGGWYTGKLAQSGTIEFQPSGTGENQAWWEILPTYPSIVTVNLYATVGHDFESDVNWNGTTYNFFLQNNYTGKYLSINVTNSNYDGRTADFVVERPEVGGSLSNLSNFKTMTLGNNWFNSGTYIGNAANILKITMYNSSDGNTLATPSSIYNSGKSFQVTQHHCH